MASKRRPPDPRGTTTLGTLLRSALAQAGGVREVLERGVREGRERFDSYRSDARRNDALIELGEIVLDLVRRGEIDPEELPEARDVLRHLDKLDGDDADAGHAREPERTRGRDREVAQPPSRSRFDTRSSRDDGTTSSSRWTPPKPAKPAARVWRPVDPGASVDEAPQAAAPPARRVPLPKDPHRKGGISFGDDEDADLADYMHPDDVPAKPSNDD
ncbi:MAG: hypothetical protein ACKV2T_35515 [Kofleriaceae bacterium]